MFNIRIPSKIPEIEQLFDELITKPFVKLPENHGHARIFGIYTKPLKERQLLKLYRGYDGNETIAVLKINNFYKPNNVKKKKGKETMYIFDDLLIPKI